MPHTHVTPDRSIDLHAHTTASDGEFSPTELVRQASEIGLTAIAVTDHDTTAGVKEAIEAGKAFNVKIVPGIELSASFTAGQCHILGLFVDPDGKRLNERLNEVRANRDKRNDRIIAKMNERGLDVTIEDVKMIAGGAVVARPHFARLLVDRGVVSTIQEAFDQYLASGASTYVARDVLEPAEAIELIHSAGGVAILAHPNLMKRDPEITEEEIVRLQSLGLDGIEARYNWHTPEDVTRYLALADRHELLTSGGSDYHGPSVKKSVFLGHVEGDKPAPTALIEQLRARAQRQIPNPLTELT